MDLGDNLPLVTVAGGVATLLLYIDSKAYLYIRAASP
jgi:hypothetical protein